jgi:tetratricopeptide (TPR) repeat protein
MEIIQTYQYGLKNLPLNETLLYDMVNESRRMVRELLDNAKSKEDSARASNYIRLALDYGERLLIINPQHFKGMLHVADCYRMVRRYADARELLERARQISPEDENLKVIERMLDRDENAQQQAGKSNG